MILTDFVLINNVSAKSCQRMLFVKLASQAISIVCRQRMHEQMQRHLEAMEGMKTHSMSILNGLQDRVSSLQGVLSESSSSLNNSTSPGPPTAYQRTSSPQRYKAVRDSSYT